jgi:phytanoyl-CoA hydroxylase
MSNLVRSVQSDAYKCYTYNGWVVIPGLVSTKKVDNLLQAYEEQIVPSKAKFFRQTTSLYETNRFTSGGHVIQSFLDIHNYKKYPEFRKSALEIYFSKEMLDTLSEVSGFSSHNLMQSMLFDANPTTRAHQDWWYLDSVPNGNLLSAWIALEDIEEDAGRFYVLSQTHKTALHEKGMSQSRWLARIKEYTDTHADQVVAPALKKGDVLFWNSGTIHGSFPTKDWNYSRKSLTAQYMPSELTFGNLFITKPWIKYETYEGHRYFANQPEYSLKAELISKVKVALYDNPQLLAFARKFQKRSLAEM